MLQKIKRNIKNIFVWVLLSLYSSQSLAQNELIVQPGYDTKNKYSLARFQGKSKPTDKLTIFGFLDIYGKKEKPFDSGEVYFELKGGYSLKEVHDKLKKFGIATEINGGTRIEDILRFGISYAPNKDISFKFLPYETSGKKKVQIGLFTSQKFTDRFNGSLLVEYNPYHKNIYSEQEIMYKFNEKFSIGLHNRIYGSFDDRVDIFLIPSFKYKF